MAFHPAHLFDRYLERQHQFVAGKRAFTTDLSHELRTPLAVIEGASAVAREDPKLDGRMRDREELSRIFERYFPAPKALAAPGNGLALVEHVCDRQASNSRGKVVLGTVYCE